MEIQEDLRGKLPSDPTPEEIRARAAEIRERWRPETFLNRAGVSPMSMDVCLDRKPVLIFNHSCERIIA